MNTILHPRYLLLLILVPIVLGALGTKNYLVHKTSGRSIYQQQMRSNWVTPLAHIPDYIEPKSTQILPRRFPQDISFDWNWWSRKDTNIPDCIGQNKRDRTNP